MPIVTVKMLEGRNDDQKRNLVEQITSTIVETVDATPESVTVIIEEMKPTHYGKAGKRPSDA